MLCLYDIYILLRYGYDGVLPVSLFPSVGSGKQGNAIAAGRMDGFGKKIAKKFADMKKVPTFAVY